MRVVEYNCDAPDEIFARTTDEIPEDMMNIIDRQHGLPCDAGGLPGEWCSSCHWTGGKEVLEDDDDYEY